MSSSANILRRIASLGVQDPSSQEEPMSPLSGDAPSSPDSSRAGGLASVFKGLTSSKLTKSPPPQVSTPSTVSVSALGDSLNAPNPAGPSGLSPIHMESFEQLKNGTPSERVAAANSLRYAVAEFPLNPVLDIWYAAKDMIESSKTTMTRVAGWELLTECITHSASTDLERREFFQTICAPAHPDDFHLQLAALVDLTNHGRDLSGFDYDVIPLLKTWLETVYLAVRVARKQASRNAKSSGKAKVSAAGEEKNLTQLFIYVIDVIKFSSNVINEKALASLIGSLLNICMNTSVEGDLRSCIAVIDAIVTFGAIPNEKLKECIQVLSSIYCLVSGLQKDAWHTLSILCRSHNAQATVRILLDVLRNHPTEGGNERDVNREVRGALAVLHKLLNKSVEKGYPSVPFALLMDGLSTTIKTTSSARVHFAALQLINALFDNGDRKLHSMIVDEDWTIILEVAAECAKRAIIPAAALEATARSNGSKEEYERPEEPIRKELLRLITRLEELIEQKTGDFIPRQIVIKFFADIHHVLPDSAAGIVLDYFQEFRCCSPSDLQWEDNLALVLNAFYGSRRRSTAIRLRALQAITDAYEMLDLVIDGVDDNCVPNLVKDILSFVAEEDDLVVLDGVVDLMVTVALSSDRELFDYIIDTLWKIVVNDRLRSPISQTANASQSAPGSPNRPTTFAQTPSNVVTKGYVKVFIKCMDIDGLKCGRIFNILVNIAKSNLCETDARITAMKLLIRLRADWANRIFLTLDTESDGLAAALYRTEASLARKQAEDANQPSRLSRAEHGGGPRSSRGISFGQNHPPERNLPMRSASGAKLPTQNYTQAWSLPDTGALPGYKSATVSAILISEGKPSIGSEDETENSTPVSLNMTAWLEAILNQFLQGCDWEVYSFILVHLPSQLSNHAIFRSSIPQIQEFRRVICEQIRMNSFQEPPNSSGLRRADVAICLFHSLTMILSYHENFQKGEEDEIVRTFVHGIGTWERCAKYCIHALSICCHELPLSTSKSLVQMLQKMSQVITQPHVAMHILEFLACLSRLQSLYVNFREDEHRIVFGICFRYLQYVRDKKQAQRGSQMSELSSPSTPISISTDATTQPSASDDLPQYVYALAYHVITFWFLALRLPDRANHVGWIAKNLFADSEGGQAAEEQALITLDFMQRVAYADVDESSEDPLFTPGRFGEILKRRWLIGNSIVTVEQATAHGWAQVTKRQPSGTSSYIVRETFRPPRPHQENYLSDITREGQASINNVLPSHLMVQLMTSLPQSYDTLRPVPLPEDDMVERAIRVFDRFSTVDGHKVGVIYIGEGQTQEADILANVSGSSDYVDFLNGLGTLTKLKGATFNTQGLDREYGSDGQYAFCWRDRVTEIVFHVTTQMPTDLERDPMCNNKKRHIGNDFVNIIFNDSGLPFKFDTFPSEFNFVNIVITPESRASFIASREKKQGEKTVPFYKVQVMSKPGFPEISPASETKMVSLRALPGFIRLLAINASVFSLVWANREGGEHISSWRGRLREIKRLREKYGPKTVAAPAMYQNHHHHHHHPHQHQHQHHHSVSSLTPSPPATSLGGAVVGGNLSGPPQPPQQAGELSRPSSSVRDSFSSLRRSSVATFFTSTSEQTSHRSSMLSTATTDTEIVPMNALDSLVESVDFSKWA
jgi:hypothetical protein